MNTCTCSIYEQPAGFTAYLPWPLLYCRWAALYRGLNENTVRLDV